MISLLHYWYGSLLISLRGFSPERFLNLCSANEIEIWGLHYVGDGYRLYMTVKGYRQIKPLVRKSKVRLQILGKFGLPFFLHRNRKRKLFFAGFFCFFLLTYMMSLFIWDIEFAGNSAYTYDTLLKYLESQDVRYGMTAARVDCDKIEEDLRAEFAEITWVSARVSGTRLLIKIKENEVLSSVPEKDTTPCDIVASKSGIITKMIVRQGVPQVSLGDEVEQGQVLVSGIIPITNDAEEVVTEHYVRADADILAQTQYSYEEQFPVFHPVTVETGKVRNGLFAQIFGHSAVVILPKPKDTTWTLLMEEHQAKLFQNFYLPIYWGKITGKEYITYERPYTEAEKNTLKEEYDSNFVEKLMEKGVQIIENNVKILNSASEWRIVGEFTTQESIAQIQLLEERNPEETKIVDERNGEYH